MNKENQRPQAIIEADKKLCDFMAGNLIPFLLSSGVPTSVVSAFLLSASTKIIASTIKIESLNPSAIEGLFEKLKKVTRERVECMENIFN